MVRMTAMAAKASAIMILVMIATVGNVSRAAAETPYADPQGRYAFLIPDDFAIQEPGSPGINLIAAAAPAIYVASAYPDAGVFVRAIAASQQGDPPIAETQAALRDLAARGAMTSPDSVQGTILGQRPATQIEYTYQAGTSRMRVIQYAVWQRSTLYVITFAARATDFAAFYEDAKVMIDSFTFSP